MSFQVLWKYKLYWMTPLVLTLIVGLVVLFLGRGDEPVPFLYSIY